MTGLLAIYAFDELWSLTTYIKYGLMALQHRGSDKYVACLANGDIKCHTSKSIDDIANKVQSNKAIAATYSVDEEPLYLGGTERSSIALLAERPHKALDELSEDLCRNMGRGLALGIKEVLKHYSDMEDIPSFIAIANNGDIVVWRSPGGLMPLVLGGYGFDMAIASSESTAIDILDGDLKRYLAPGEGLFISRYFMKSFRIETAITPRLCLFELLYLARHDAMIDGVSVYEFRKSLGEELAKTFNEDIDLVVGVPETALPYAIGFSKALNKPFELAFVATGSRTRSMLKIDPHEKLMAIHLKMNPIRSSLEGKRVALVDDSMVTGSTAKTVSQILRYRIGVEEIHLLIASPPLVSQCPYNIMKLNIENLLAANLTKEMAKKYLEVESLHWLSPEGINNIAKRFGLKFCGKCFGIDFLG